MASPPRKLGVYEVRVSRAPGEREPSAISSCTNLTFLNVRRSRTVLLQPGSTSLNTELPTCPIGDRLLTCRQSRIMQEIKDGTEHSEHASLRTNRVDDSGTTNVSDTQCLRLQHFLIPLWALLASGCAGNGVLHPVLRCVGSALHSIGLIGEVKRLQNQLERSQNADNTIPNRGYMDSR
jgi:hypothetical protein